MDIDVRSTSLDPTAKGGLRRDPSRLLAQITSTKRHRKNMVRAKQANTKAKAQPKSAGQLLFKPFPSPFVFPGLPILAMQVYMTSLVYQATTMIVDPERECFVAKDMFDCRPLGIGTVLLAVAYEIFTISLVVKFYYAFGKQCWSKCVAPTEANKVADPLFRLLSKVRSCTLPKQMGKPVDRPRGAMKKPPKCTQEPARTERLLKSPRRLWFANAADAIDGIGFALMARSGGDSLPALLFEMVLLAANLVLAMLSGVGTILPADSLAALVLMGAAVCVRLAIIVYVLSVCPSADRVMNLLTVVQFGLEAVGVILMLLTSIVDSIRPDDVHGATLVVFMAALLAPVAQRFYDSLVVHFAKVMRGQRFTWKAFFLSLIGLAAILPGALIKIAGCQCCSSTIVGVSNMAGDDINKLAAKLANEGLVQSIEEGVAEIASRAFWEAHARAHMRRQWSEEDTEAVARVIQARWRARQARRRRAHSSLAKAGATRVAMKRMQTQALLRQGTNPNFMRPGFEWLQMRMDEISDDYADHFESLKQTRGAARRANFISSLPAGLPPAAQNVQETPSQTVVMDAG